MAVSFGETGSITYVLKIRNNLSTKMSREAPRQKFTH
jgi:hypothetical protein